MDARRVRVYAIGIHFCHWRGLTDMERLLKILDLSLLSSVLTGALYVLGYSYFVYYYHHFGINILVRDPDVPTVMAKGFAYLGQLALLCLAAGLVFMLCAIVLRRFTEREVPRMSRRQALSIGALLAAATFFSLIPKLMDFVEDDAVRHAGSFVAQQRHHANARVWMTGGKELQGQFVLFFVGREEVIFLDYSADTETRPRVVMLPRREIAKIDL